MWEYKISWSRQFPIIPSSLPKRDIFIIIKSDENDRRNRGPNRTESRNTITSERQATTHYNIATIIYRNLRRKIPSRDISIKLPTTFTLNGDTRPLSKHSSNANVSAFPANETFVDVEIRGPDITLKCNTLPRK